MGIGGIERGERIVVIYFTSDEHYNHEGIIKYCKRPFQSVKEMNEAMIERFNSVVTPSDETWHGGDFAWTEAGSILPQLHGRHYLVLGNHDKRHLSSWEFCMFDKVLDVQNVKYYHQKIFLSHYAHAKWPGSHRGSFHVFGHSHGLFPGLGRSMDIGVDAHDFKPISFEEVVTRLESKEVDMENYAGEFYKGPEEPID